MIKHRIKFLSIMMFVIVVFTSCSKLNNNLNQNENIDEGTLIKNNPTLSIADNESKYTDLITRKYSYEDLLECRRYGRSIEEIDLKCKIECLRKVNEQTYYAILESTEGGLLIILFKYNDKDKLAVSGFWYMETFKTLKRGNTWEDVIKIDKFGEGPFFYVSVMNRPLKSQHETIDGYIIQITYKRGNTPKESKIKKIDIRKSIKYPMTVYANLFTMDIETIKEEQGEKQQSH